MSGFSEYDLIRLERAVAAAEPNWKRLYDGSLLEAARDLGLLDDDDPAEGTYDELDLSEAAAWRRLAGKRDEEEEDDDGL